MQLHLIPVWLNSPFPIITQKLSKIFLNTECRKLCSVRDSSWVTTAVNERGEGTVFAGRAYLLRCTSFPFYDCIPNTTEKRRRVFPFPNNHRRPSQILTTLLLTFFSTFSIRPSKIFLFLQRIYSLFFLLLLYGLAFPRFLTARQVTNAAVFRVRIGWKYFTKFRRQHIVSRPYIFNVNIKIYVIERRY